MTHPDGGIAAHVEVRLTDGWTLSPAGGDPPGTGPPEAVRAAFAAGPLPATVPGCVHTDLLAAGLIPDPYLDDNETRLAWIGRTGWAYETSFDWAGAPGARTDLVFDGLDTVASVTLNDVEVGRAQNMHRGHRFDVGALLRKRDNRLVVRFDSAYAYAEALRDRVGERPGPYPEPFNFIRKMACNFGWDWGPTLVTAGIWREVRLHEWSTARLAEVRPLVTVEGAAGTVELRVRLERAGDTPVSLTAAVGGVVETVRLAAGESEAVVTVTVPDVARWWPRGYGEQARYDVRLVLEESIADTAADTSAAALGRELDVWERRIGFRDVRLDAAPDEAGTPFTVVVNDVPVFARGVNWIPDDTFPSRITRQRLVERLTQACGANVNFLRVWGGGVYESEDFYDVADELGLLVEQDFLFACAAYPEDEPLRSEIEAEARENVVRLASHPSLVMWVGNNENIWGFHDWGWQEPLAGRAWGEGYYLDLLPRVVSELDPTRPYWPGSPYSGRPDLHPNDPAHGSMHIWDVWNREDYTRYRAYRPRFVAEFGYQAPPAYATLRRALSDEPLAPDSPGMSHHQKAEDGDGKLRRGLAAHLPEPRDFDDWHYLTQVNQARAITLGVEHFRSLRPHCMGAVVWQLNDCWPVTSWAAVDSDGRRKPLWYALRRVFADRLLTIQPTDDGLDLVAVNDGGGPWTARVDVARLALGGEPWAKTVVDLTVPPMAAVRVPLPPDVATADDPYAEMILAGTADGDPTDEPTGRAWWFFAEDRDLAVPPAAYDAAVEPGVGPDRADELRVTVTARTLLRDVVLYPDRLSPAAAVDRALVTLLPGESATFVVTGVAGVDPAALTTRPVLRCVNDIPKP
ncbi:MAG TPA: glycoside hydrolase family 2 protein [Micromonosporaceae bacterium]|nr:glycoside hydrolase family 2 protein [Micromonosporaceae bacterium]